MTYANAARRSTNGSRRVTSTLRGMADAAAGILHRLGCTASCMGRVRASGSAIAAELLGTEVLPHPLGWPPISKAYMENGAKWRAAARSKDHTRLNRMLEHCKGHGKKYTDQMYTASVAAHQEKPWKNLTNNIIRAQCMDFDRFEREIFELIKLGPLYPPFLADVLDGIAGKMDRMPITLGIIILDIGMMHGPKTYPGCAGKIHEHVTHAALKELGAIAMIKNKEERRAAFGACLKLRKDWPHGLIEAMTEHAYLHRQYHTLEVLLGMKPKNKGHLRRQTVKHLWDTIRLRRGNDADECIRIFDISTDEVHDALKKVVGDCIYSESIHGLKRLIEFLDNTVEADCAMVNTVKECTISLGSIRMFEYILQFLDNKPQQYRLAVEAGLEKYAVGDTCKCGKWSQEHHQMLQDWITNEKRRQESRGYREQDRHLSALHPIAKQAYVTIRRYITLLEEFLPNPLMKCTLSSI